MLARMIDPATLALVGKLIGLGIAVKKGWETDKLDDDVGAAKSFLDTGAEVAKVWSRGKDARASALHLALVTRAFGKALAQYWPDVITPEVIERCLKRASLKIADPNQFLPDEKALTLLQALSGEPTGNPYYKTLWEAFFSEPVELPGDKGSMDLRGENPQVFHAYFRRAYVEALATPEGQQVQHWCLSLAAEKREVMRHILAEDLAAWGKRHVFGNVRRQAPGDPMPFLSLDDSYVEPRGRYAERDEPILGLLSRLLETHPLVVVRADFGHGKSLTARRLARDVARAWLESRQPAGESRYPVFIKCSRDLRDARYDHDAVVRSALWHGAEEAVADRPAMKNEAFAPLESDRAALFILDGLDEVALTRNHLEDLFKDLRAALGPGQRAVVLTRPGVLRDERWLPKATPVVDLRDFDDTQISAWIERWNQLSGKPPVDMTRLGRLGLSTLACTPILLLMIAVTWHEHLASGSQVSKASLYEHFFQHIARGKYEVRDGETHDAVIGASTRLTRELQRRDILREENPVEAMLWLMSRVAWEAHTLAYERPARTLHARHVASLLDRELGIDDAAKLEYIEMGLLLVMQIDPTGASSSILFGHKSFREFLVARYWKHQLLCLSAPGTSRDRYDHAEARLMQSRLLQDEDEAFFLLMEMLQNLDAGTRRDIKGWARKYLETDEVCLTHRASKIDRRPVLRESALAIGSYIEPSEGLQLNEWALRLLCSWHEFYGYMVEIRAPNLSSPGCRLSGVELVGAFLRNANLEGADLGRVKFERVNLQRANLRGANLENADLVETILEAVDLVGANLSGADLHGATLIRALLEGANLGRACLKETYFINASLEGAQLIEADLSASLFAGANLARADLERANLEDASLEQANLEGANLRQADLKGANLKGANLKSARVSRKQLADANIEGALGLDNINELPDPS